MGPLWRVWDRHGRGQKIAPSGGRKSGPARGPERGARRGLRGPENGLRGARSGFSASNILCWGHSTFERGVSGWRGNVKMRVGRGVWGPGGGRAGARGGQKKAPKKSIFWCEKSALSGARILALRGLSRAHFSSLGTPPAPASPTLAQPPA